MTARTLALALATAPAPLVAQDYSLLHRTPRAEVRPLATDRPDRTESAYTVPAGWYQVEASAVSWSLDREANASSESVGVAQLNLKAGVLHNVDVQLLAELWSREVDRERNAAARTTERTLGLVAARVKVNLWGNDGGRTALAVMPFAGAVRQQSIPGVQRTSHAIAGVIIPFALDAGRGWSVGAMLELDVANDLRAGWRASAVQSITVGRAIVGPVRGYLEVFHASGGGARDEVTADGGITWTIGSDVQLDAGLNVGVTSAADDLNPFVGLAVRF